MMSAACLNLKPLVQSKVRLIDLSHMVKIANRYTQMPSNSNRSRNNKNIIYNTEQVIEPITPISQAKRTNLRVTKQSSVLEAFYRSRPGVWFLLLQLPSLPLHPSPPSLFLGSACTTCSWLEAPSLLLLGQQKETSFSFLRGEESSSPFSAFFIALLLFLNQKRKKQ
ncbi:hypothetical protein Cni_G05009 [Canna indica]|uniref:Uncharacterized protein n=1 Tax=Canna indica TaxID=4628 RepID=A0AAQ3JWF4_9LILI|nr:hypothetical protein Cni_G05009 [Canna indica]